MADRWRGLRSLDRYVSHLCFRYRDDAPDWAISLINALSDRCIEDLSVRQWDTAERLLCAVLGAMRASVMLKQGASVRAWRPRSGQPSVRRTVYGDWEFAKGASASWIDHPYRLVFKQEDGSQHEYFCSEPYSLSAEALRDLVALADQGWSVSVGTDWALHYPGSTLHVRVSKPRTGEG